MDLGLRGKVAVVTGASKGMGRWTAVEFAREGADVVVVARGAAALASVAGQIEALGVRALAVPADLATAAGTEELFDRVRGVFGGCDILVNTLGSDEYDYLPLTETSDELFRAHLEIGLMAGVRTCRAAIPLMRTRGGGAIVNLAAMSIRKQYPTMVAYTAAKAALASVSKNLARAHGPDGIRVNTVCPGAILTEGVREKIEQFGPGRWVAPDALGASAGAPSTLVALGMPVAPSTEEVFLAISRDMGGAGRGLVPDLGRPGRPEEIAAAIVFLCSARAGYITGALLNVDGGSDF
ncbi:SDR family NAD(P)-dependent oxidoreductase [Frankia tisae]|uniref:SDR family NAD(P)-dependent oxidoreductase n=1 Tax=Frankia tisae TaxID=2950104 RepID=UPI0021BED38E|nr:SDR family oxidoreductase [Frankia tisae]